MDVIKEGYLNKKSQFIGSSRKRWMVLNCNELKSYKKKQTYKNCTESFDLNIYNQINFDIKDNKAKTFKLLSSNKKKENRIFIATSNAEMLEWVTTIQSIQNKLNSKSLEQKSNENEDEKSCSISSDSEPDNETKSNGNNPYYDKELMNNLSQFSPEANKEFIATHNKTKYQFPLKIQGPTEQTDFKKLYDKKDLEIEQFLCNKYKTEFQSFNTFCDFTIIRFVFGYRHITEFSKRLQQTDSAFKDYLNWAKSINYDSIILGKLKQLNNLDMMRYMNGCFIYGQDKYGHPLLWDDGARFNKKADMSMHKKLNERQRDQVLGHVIGRTLQNIKIATSKFYNLNTKFDFDVDEKHKEDEKNNSDAPKHIYKPSYSSGIYGQYILNIKDEKRQRKIGIYQHCLIFDVKKLNSKRVLKDRKIHELYSKRAQLICPEITYKIYVINTPWVFQKVWKIAQSFLDENTISKTKILGKNYMNELLKDIDIHMIPVKYGGMGSWDINYGSVPKKYPIQPLNH